MLASWTFYLRISYFPINFLLASIREFPTLLGIFFSHVIEDYLNYFFCGGEFWRLLVLHVPSWVKAPTGAGSGDCAWIIPTPWRKSMCVAFTSSLTHTELLSQALTATGQRKMTIKSIFCQLLVSKPDFGSPCCSTPVPMRQPVKRNPSFLGHLGSFGHHWRTKWAIPIHLISSYLCFSENSWYWGYWEWAGQWSGPVM